MIGLLALLAAAKTTYDVTQFGAIGDGKTMCTAAIQAAIDRAATGAGGVVLIPSGRFLTGSLILRSHVEMHLDTGAILLGSGRRKFYQKGNWYALLLAKDLEDIAITGAGTIDGQGKRLAQDVLAMVETGEVKIPRGKWRPSEVDRPQIIEFDHCKGVRLEGVTIKNSACWVQTYRRCTDLTLTGIHVDSKTYWNNDGMDIVDCRNVHVANCDVDAADDGICLKSESRDGFCERILIENCNVRSSASAIKFGTASQGGFRDVAVRGIKIHDTYRSCVALESVDGGTLENVLVENIRATNTGNAFFIRLGHRNLGVAPGSVRHVVLRDFDVQVPAGQPDKGYPFQGPPFTEPHNVDPSSIVGHPQAAVEDVLLDNIKIRVEGGGSAKIANVSLDNVPERPSDYPDFTMFGELPAWGLYLRHVHGLRIHNFELILDHPDYRPPFAGDDLVGLKAEGIAVHGADPVFTTRHCRDLKVDAGITVNRLSK
jgi:polygalacturonase